MILADQQPFELSTLFHPQNPFPCHELALIFSSSSPINPSEYVVTLVLHLGCSIDLSTLVEQSTAHLPSPGCCTHLTLRRRLLLLLLLLSSLRPGDVISLLLRLWLGIIARGRVFSVAGVA
jgi:hypothetical protein